MDQLTLNLEPGLEAHRDVRECFAACVYRNGLKRVAGDLNVQPSHLSEMLSGTRNLDVLLIEEYVRLYNDPTPVLFLVARHLRDPASRQQAAVEQLHSVMRQLAPLIQAAGLGPASVPRAATRTRR